jgi:DNA-binding transcriptional LysR family regulator
MAGMERLGDLELFVRIAARRSISAAARDLDLSPALASQRLQRLEKSLDARLFQRTTRRVALTAEGELLLERAQHLIDELAEAGQRLKHGREAIAGPLRITMSSSFGRRWISPLLPRFLARHPGVELHAHFSDQIVDLVSQGMDLAIRIGDLADSSLVARRIAHNRRILCAAPAYLARAGMPRSPADLAKHNCLVLVGQAGRLDRWTLDGPRGLVTVQVDGNFETNLGEVLRDAAVEGAGICVQSLWNVGDELRAGELVQVLSRFPLPLTGIHAVLPQRRFVPARVDAFVAFLREALGDPPVWERGLEIPVSGSSPRSGVPRAEAGPRKSPVARPRSSRHR